MRNSKVNFLFSITLLLTFTVVGFAQKTTNPANPPPGVNNGLNTALTVNANTEGNNLNAPRLAVEIDLNTPLTVNAGTERNNLNVFWRVPVNANGLGTV